jgi:uncharacterized BrkB/YihY/UPF0761 family membrane protein
MNGREDIRNATKDERSLGTLFSELSQETSTLVQQEVALAKAEMSEKLSHFGHAIASLAIGGLVLFAGLLVLLDAVVYGISELLPPELRPWLAALIVGAIVAGIGFILLQKGRGTLQSGTLTPQRTAESLRRDKDMVKEHVQ